ncbi:hypothetical protein cyc_04199, partial [Cyclospora cayetanensis]
MKQVEEEASSEVETSEESLLEELLQSSLGFIGGSASPLSPAGATLSGSKRSLRPHNQLSANENKASS